MTTPSIKELSRVFTNPEAAEKIFKMSYDELIQTDTGKARLKACLGPIEYIKDYDLILDQLNASEPKFYGAESVELPSGEFASYLNAGETYAKTVIYYDNEFRVQSFGDFIKEIEASNPDLNPKDFNA